MVDNVEIKLEQLTEAIRSLYSRPALSQSEINNLMTSLAQKFENSADGNSQKLVGIVANETRKILEEKHHEITEKLYSFESIVKQLVGQANNPKTAMEITKILSEITSMYSKLSNQEIALQKINQTLAASKTSNALSEILKLSNDFATFSRGFENITHTLNKNFSDFLEQVKGFSSKEELARMQIELDTISGNVNSVISAIAIIDHKYQDLTGLLDVVHKKESAFNESLTEVKQILGKFDVLNDTVSRVGSKEDFKVISEKITYMTDAVSSAQQRLNEDLSTRLANMTSSVNDSQKRIDTAIADKLSMVSNTLNETQGKIDATLNSKLDNINSAVNDCHTKFDGTLNAKVQALNYSMDEGINAAKDMITGTREALDRGFEGTKDLISGAVNVISEANSQISSLSQNLAAAGEKINEISQKTALQGDLANLRETFVQKSEANINELRQKLEKITNLAETNNTRELAAEIKSAEAFLTEITKESASNVMELISNEFNGFVEKIQTRDGQNLEGYEFAIKTLRSDIKTFMTNFSSLKDEISKINQGNIKILQEPIERALKDLRENTFGEQLVKINDSVKETTTNISSSFEEIRKSFEEVANSTNVQVLSQLRDMIPEISDKLEIFRNHVVSENTANLTELKSCFYEIAETIKVYLEDTTYKVQDEIKKTYDESITAVKIDLQDLSNHLIESVEGANANIKKEFDDYKNQVTELISKLEDANDKIDQRLTDIQDNIQTSVQNFNSEAIQKIQDSLQVNQAVIQDSMGDLKNDLVAGILGSSKNNKTNFGILEEKINKIIETTERAELNDSNAPILEAIGNVDDKVERTNLQQIHNAKELMEEIQNISAEVVRKFENSNSLTEVLNSIETKLLNVSGENRAALKESIENTSVNVNSTIQEYFEQISELVQQIKIENTEKFDEIPEFETYLNRIDEYLSHVEYLRNNLSQDIKDCVELQISNFEEKIENALNAQKADDGSQQDILQRVVLANENLAKLQTNISKIISNTQNTDYAYSLQDVESDLAKLRLSVERVNKNENYKEFVSRLIELKNINIENNKLNHLLESQMTQINNWLKTSAQRLEAMSEQIKENEQMNMEEIKARLVHSEKSGQGAKNEAFERKQIGYFEELNEKLESLLAQQNPEFDPTSFIDVTYENMKQTKELGARMTSLEGKVDKIQGYLEKIVSYIQEEE